MSGHHKFSELIKDFTPEDRKIIEAQKSEMRAAMEVEPSPQVSSSKIPEPVPSGQGGTI